ncbi:NmrA-like family protein-like protein [Setomelanomma holmii]|uniref:NmrA-like family protein-like protein n=1 Tax=Setomelanomma holmii TaxID=210430 RepID=A0A9P4H5Y9_9PLEO|nr:NmrA-like family protein-like protein [Setomelanomma holmii]
MVKIAVAGGTGNVATELLRAPLRSGNHEITVFTRASPPSDPIPGVTYLQVNYHDLPSLLSALTGFQTVLSFLIAHLDTNNIAQKNLIHASIAAGVSRFAPSEWSLASNSGVPAYAPKDEIAAYLSDLKARGELGHLEYCLFQPSVFMDYFAHPHPLSSGLITWPFFIDFEKRRAIVLDDGDVQFNVTAVADVSEMLERALNDERAWSVQGGMRGDTISINELLALGKKLRGGEWQVECVKSEHVARGELKTSFVPQFSHPAVPPEQREAFSVQFVVDFFNAMKKGSWDTGDAWNRRFPEYKFTRVEEYLVKAWEGKP